MSELVQWLVCGVILLGALALLAWSLGWLPRKRAAGATPGCGASCPKCGAAEEIAKRLKQL